jgi:hypothetical protein
LNEATDFSYRDLLVQRENILKSGENLAILTCISFFFCKKKKVNPGQSETTLVAAPE